MVQLKYYRPIGHKIRLCYYFTTVNCTVITDELTEYYVEVDIILINKGFISTPTHRLPVDLKKTILFCIGHICIG